MTSKSSSPGQKTSLAFGFDSRFDYPFDEGQWNDKEFDGGALRNGRLIALVGRPHGTAIQHPQQFVIDALDEPIGFPPLIEATVPGDRVAIAVGHGIPQVAAIVAGIIESLANGRVEPADICVVFPSCREDGPSRIRQDVAALLPNQIFKAITFQQHDPADRNQLSYLAASSDANPIFFNRSICEADLVIPVGCLRPAGALGYIDDAMGLFPTFADEKTIRHLCAPSSWMSPAQRESHHDKAREAAWLLGVTFTVQVLPGSGDQVLRVLAGEREAVFAAGRAEMENAWACSVPTRASLVVAAIEGGPSQQTWDSFGSALSAALKIVDDDGAIVVCSEMAELPGKTLLKIRGMDPDSEFGQIESAVSRETDSDAVVAAQLIEALRRVRVYLYSELEDELVEELGIAPVGRTEEIKNLCQRSSSCIFLANAQHAVPVVDAE
jgi:nickel-dependent lactate racemase